MDKGTLLEQEIALCQLDDLQEMQTIELSIEERKLFAIRRDNQLYAYWNSCPHLGIPLNWMPDKFLDLDGSLIQCSSHGALFQVESGECITGPCAGDHLMQVELRVEDGSYYVAANQPMPAPPINLRAQALADLEDS
ncbi:MAG: Rieske (2Fe-2S) protein [Porticoccaceae bacterium]|jgi:nitrite reductase/ring-hydroxylating ferredoxin subunit|nr:Rieske (2Fe-2S) protein [Porticoccaceae bacterium]MBT6319449.1 Rieske (2Fe-2S) protein [Porticoccaceae bacterium]MBT7258418.1 Rieske (2Fe-2S) protein [Porticoccaceae bacterium]MDA8734838.1 Rieske (2Fe-2S) protein [Porticoccaceae bacterium]MDB2479733.1 Rieske (2Fe-2S) protein [Porticoccaceae bacterium]